MSFRIAIGLSLLAVFIYGLIEGYSLIRGPELSVTTTIEDRIAHLSGEAERADTVTINGGILLIDEFGNFSKDFAAPSGITSVVLTARDRFGRIVTNEQTIFIP